jgi:uncharacterized protein (TIGR02145 family)
MAGTRYYVRAYAKNAVGTGYSEEVIFDIPLPKFGELVDERDGKKYKTVKIGNQEWMAEDLNYDYIWSGIDERTGIRLYNGVPEVWPFPMAKDVPPEGWHIPTTDEIAEMLAEIGFSNTNYHVGSCILTSGTNTTGLGLNVTKNYSGYYYDAWLWSSSSFLNYGLGIAYCYSISSSGVPSRHSYAYGQNVILPVRCIKD